MGGVEPPRSDLGKETDLGFRAVFFIDLEELGNEWLLGSDAQPGNLPLALPPGQLITNPLVT